jgi:hypothetical protein
LPAANLVAGVGDGPSKRPRPKIYDWTAEAIVNPKSAIVNLWT